MFIIEMLFSKKPDHVAFDAEVICPDVAQADAAEDFLFYGDDPPPNMILVRLSPTTIRVSSLDFDPGWNEFFAKLLEEGSKSSEETIRMRAPRFASFDFLHVQRNAVQATVRCDVPAFQQLALVADDLTS